MHHYYGLDCPAISKETIIQDDASIDVALAHCMYYGIWDLELYVGPNPSKGVEIKASDITMKEPYDLVHRGKIEMDDVRRVEPRGRRDLERGKNRCRLCKQVGHYKKICRRRKKFLLQTHKQY